jgi:hypothetical protein
MSEARTNGKRPSCTRHDKSGTEAVEKIKSCVGKDGGELKQSHHLLFFNRLALAHDHAHFFSIAVVKLLA